VPITRSCSDRCQREIIFAVTERSSLSAERIARLIRVGSRRRTQRSTRDVRTA